MAAHILVLSLILHPLTTVEIAVTNVKVICPRIRRLGLLFWLCLQELLHMWLWQVILSIDSLLWKMAPLSHHDKLWWALGEITQVFCGFQKCKRPVKWHHDFPVRHQTAWPELHSLWISILSYLSNSAARRGKNTTHLSLLFDCYPLYDFLADIQWFFWWGNYVLVDGQDPKPTSLLPLWDKFL